MSKLLYIKANAKPDDISRTFRLSNHFVETYKKANPNDEIITLDLYKEGITFLQPEYFMEQKTEGEEGKNHPILKYAHQFFEADKYVIAEPMWNLSVPAILKAYIDYIMATGITFKYTENGPVGLCEGKAVNITTRGGKYSEGPAAAFEMGDRYLRTAFTFLGIKDFTTIAAEELDVIGIDTEAILTDVLKEAESIAKNF